MRTITNLKNNGLTAEQVKGNENYFSKADMRLLRTCEDLDARMHDLQVFTNRYKDYYTPRCIARTFIQFKENMDEIMALEDEFRQLKIITPFNRLHVITLDELLKLMNLENGIKTEAKNFYDEFWQKMKNHYEFGHILFEFKQSKKIGQVA